MRRSLIVGVICALLAATGAAFSQTQTFTNFILSAPTGVPTVSDILACVEGSPAKTNQCSVSSIWSVLRSITNIWSGAQEFNPNAFSLNGSTSGQVVINAPATASGTITFPAGTTDFSATGGTSQVIKQTSAGGAFTVARLACSDLSNAGTGCSGSGTVSSVAAGTGLSASPSPITGAGTISLANMAATTLKGNSGFSSAAPADLTPAQAAGVVAIRGYLSGLTLSTAGSSATFSVAAGTATDSTAAQAMVLASAISKTTGAWAVGTGNGCLDTGTIATATWYAVFEIERTDTGVVDIVCSKETAAVAPTPALPASYTLYRYIGSMLTDGSSHWTAFTQDGDYFVWSTSVGDVAATNPGNSAVSRTLTVPLGVNVTAFGLINVVDTAGVGFGILLSDLAASDETAANTLCTIQNQVTNVRIASPFTVRTNTSAQVRSRAFGSGASSSFLMRTQGWIDHRGQS